MSAPMDPSAPQPDPGGQLLIYRDSGLNLQVRLDGQTVWLTQRQMAELFQVTVPTVNEHLTNIYAEGEFQPEATIRQFRIVQVEGCLLRRRACLQTCEPSATDRVLPFWRFTAAASRANPK